MVKSGWFYNTQKLHSSVDTGLGQEGSGSYAGKS